MSRLTKSRKDDYGYGTKMYYTNGKISSGIVYIDDNKNFTNMAINKLGQSEDFEDELGGTIVLLRKAFNGFWFKPECLTIFNEDLERFKHKNLDYYDEDLNLYYQTGLSDCIDNVIYPTPTLGATKLDDKVIFFIASGICVVKLEDYGKTWAFTKEELL